MPAIVVSRSIEINVPAATVQQSLTDFRQWPEWSPWLCTEPEAKVDYRGQAGQLGHGYDWQGKLTGEGGMTLTGDEPGHLKMDLMFLKPFKSQAKISFEVAERGAGSSHVTWSMDSSLPFFMFFMTGTMNAMIAADYDRGLRMLKEKLETGTISSSTEVIGLVDIEPTDFVGVAAQSSMANIGPSMEASFKKVMDSLTASELTANGAPLSVYKKMDLKKSHCDYIAGIPIDAANSTLDGLDMGRILPGRAYKVIHKGSYLHLGNAWATAIAHQRDQKLKLSKQQPVFERYLTDPNETPANEQITEIYIPLR